MRRLATIIVAVTPRLLPMLAIAFVVTGCASHYTAPSPGADMRSLGATEEMKRIHGDPSIVAQFDKKPLASFPAAVAAMRVQAANYRSYTYDQRMPYPSRYTLVTTRDVEGDDQIERLTRL